MREKGHMVLDEGFVGMKHYGLDPQSLIIETFWVTGWFRRLLEMQEKLGGRTACADAVFIADRSPYSASFYARDPFGAMLRTLAKGMVAELRACGIHVHTVHVRVRDELLWRRISARLVDEPERRRFNEHERSWMDKIVGAYDECGWDAWIDNSDVSIEALAVEFADVVGALVHRPTTDSSGNSAAAGATGGVTSQAGARTTASTATESASGSSSSSNDGGGGDDDDADGSGSDYVTPDEGDGGGAAGFAQTVAF